MLQADTPNYNTQGFHAIHKTQCPCTATHIDPDDINFIDCHTHPDTSEDFVLWEDIQQAFEEALFVRQKAKMVPFVKGIDLRPYVLVTQKTKIIDPLYPCEMVLLCLWRGGKRDEIGIFWGDAY